MENNKVSQGSCSRRSGGLFLPETCHILKKGLKVGNNTGTGANGVRQKADAQPGDLEMEICRMSSTSQLWKVPVRSRYDLLQQRVDIYLRLHIWTDPILTDGNLRHDNDLVLSGRVLTGTRRTGPFWFYFTGCWVAIQGGQGVRQPLGSSGHLFRVLLQPGRCVAVFCLIRSSKQALIKKQLLTSPLRDKHTQMHVNTRARTRRQTCRGHKTTQTHR